jgi:RNA-directed DNA polymerase
LKETGPRQLNIAFADSPSGGGKTEPSDASDRRSFLLLRARSKKTRGPGTGAADTSRLLEDVASEANLAAALRKVVRNKGAPGVDGQTVETAEARRLIPFTQVYLYVVPGLAAYVGSSVWRPFRGLSRLMMSQ